MRSRYKEPLGIEKRVKDHFSKYLRLGNCRRSPNNIDTIYFEIDGGLGGEMLERMNEQFGIFGNLIHFTNERDKLLFCFTLSKSGINKIDNKTL